MRVAIIGAGVGGLALAHGLRRRGLAVSVHERDPHPAARWEGYRIHLNPHGTAALASCLPRRNLRELRDTASYRNDFTMTTEHLHELVSIPGDERWPTVDGQPSHFGVDRSVLRRVLLDGLDAVSFGAAFTDYAVLDDGRVAVAFADGSRVIADVLVGADGVGSRVARQLLPDHPPRLSGALAVVQKVPLTEARRAWIPEVLTRGMTVTCPSQPGFMFTAAFQPRHADAGRHAHSAGAYLVVSLVLDAAVTPVASLDAAALDALCTDFVSDWHPTVRRLVAEGDAHQRRVLTFRAADPLPPHPWTGAPVTLLGDAIHQMPPIGGLGGNTALRDAALLTSALGSAAGSVGQALRTYEEQMYAYAGTAVRDALKLQNQNLAPNGLFTTLPRMFYNMAGDVPAVQKFGAIAR